MEKMALSLLGVLVGLLGVSRLSSPLKLILIGLLSVVAAELIEKLTTSRLTGYLFLFIPMFLVWGLVRIIG